METPDAERLEAGVAMKVLVLGGEGMLGHKVFQVSRSTFDTGRRSRHAGRPLARRSPVRRAAPESACIDGRRRAATSRPSVAPSLERRARRGRQLHRHHQATRGGERPVLSITLNSLFPHRLADSAPAAGARLIHFSTDCVFSGRKGQYTEDDLSDAEDLYGRTKFLGEVDRPGLPDAPHLDHRPRIAQARAPLLEWFLSQRGRTGRAASRNAIYTRLHDPDPGAHHRRRHRRPPGPRRSVPGRQPSRSTSTICLHGRSRRYAAGHRDRAGRRLRLRPQPGRGAVPSRRPATDRRRGRR